jgi:Domain of unknown function (DUF4352)
MTEKQELSDNLLQEGIEALQTGNAAQARALLSNAVQANPQNEQAWLYLAAVLPPDRAIEVLERVLKLNPENEQAKKGLQALKKQAITPQFDYIDALIEEVNDQKTTRNRGFKPTDEMREMLSQIYADKERRLKRRKALIVPVSLGAVLLIGLIAATAVWFLLSSRKPAEEAAITVTTVPTIEVTAPNTMTLATPTPLDFQPTTATPIPLPTTPPILNLKVLQEERANLQQVAVTFNGYNNRSAEFTANGAGTSTAGRHFEGVKVLIENKSNMPLPISTENFKAIDGRNNFVPVSGEGGRAPYLAINRLLPSEKRSAWLTFEVEDGTTLRRLIFTPQNPDDKDNSVEVSLVLPAATPAPKATNTPLPTATPRPTNTATPVPPTATATAVPTATFTPAATFTPIIASEGGVIVPTVPGVPTNTAAPIPPTATATLAPTQTPTLAPTASPSAIPTNTATPAPTPTPAPVPLNQIALGKRGDMGKLGLTINQYVAAPAIKPAFVPEGYHYEAIKITLDNLSKDNVADLVRVMPFYLRDSEGFIYTLGAYMDEAKDKLDYKQFEATPKTPAKTKVTGTLYFLVRDEAKKLNRTLVMFNGNELDSPALEFLLK